MAPSEKARRLEGAIINPMFVKNLLAGQHDRRDGCVHVYPALAGSLHEAASVESDGITKDPIPHPICAGVDGLHGMVKGEEPLRRSLPSYSRTCRHAVQSSDVDAMDAATMYIYKEMPVVMAQEPGLPICSS